MSPIFVRVICAVVALAPAAAVVRAQEGGLRLRALSARPELVTGGDVLVGIEVPAGTSAESVLVTLNGDDVTSRLRVDEGGRSLTGVVSGLAIGASQLVVTSGNASARLTLVNHPITGPVLSSPQEQPFVCMTDRFKLQSGATLGRPLDANCSIATRVDYVYRTAAGPGLKALSDVKAVPVDAATVTVNGREVPYIVRIETGTINRGIYQIAMLHNPAADPAPDFAVRSPGWNGRLIYAFGGGCEPGWYQQGASTGGVTDDHQLRQGYAVAAASLTVAGNNCNDLISAETMMMVKERFVEAYGVPLFTIGWGSSGGAIQQYQIADNYPGLLDGLVTGRSFMDTPFASATSSGDSRLLLTYFAKSAGVPFTDEQKRAVAGFGTLETIENLSRVRAGRFSATEQCPDGLGPELRYHPVNSPTGARCTIWDHGASVYGRDTKTGFARRPLDNDGIQYGLEALDAGVITTEQFLDLNEKIGGFDIDGRVVPQRMTADPEATRAAYRTGRMASGGGGLQATPVIDYRTYYDDLPGGDVHLRFHSFSTRARLEKANGYSDNMIMLLEDRRYGDFGTSSPVLKQALAQMDLWLTTLARDGSADAPIVKLRRARPADLVDACWTKDEAPQKVVETLQYRAGRCHEIYPAYSYPRGVAGGPISNDIVKCQLKPLGAADYRVAFTADEMAQLRRIFPGGVCDWSKPGVEQQPLVGTWLVFRGGGSPTSTR
ncbi:MAG: hypothetical protein A3I61_11430 [Acidobacteria bacterium RIFCSPLOWO2_02_FULL_68_18]|nr:MAG: hypothetical protein A3I61_11430 [Acidobacteria bacterium RIFCSPLOWO2_02_FULL_68_18]OFW50671.1 MAG: hypothetical protein A3G77_17175 [Acidobacteria bacterium RIFCSPLOWO2_12_FULL_68_19]